MSANKKLIRIAERNRIRRIKVLAEMKTIIKKAEKAISSKAKDANEATKLAIKKIDKAVSNGIIHKNAGARRKSRLMKKLNSIPAAQK